MQTTNSNQAGERTHKEVAAENIIQAAHEFFLVSGRYCELNDKEKNGSLHDADEIQELRWLRVMSTCLNIYLN